MLSCPGTPTAFYPPVYDWNLKALINAREAAGVHSTLAVTVQQVIEGLYAAIVTATSRQLAKKTGPNSWSSGSGWTLQACGNNYAVWIK